MQDSRPWITVMIGAPGSGKSTWAAAHSRRVGAHDVLSIDALRRGPDRWGWTSFERACDRAFDTAMQAVVDGRGVLIDSTGSEPVRRRARVVARGYGARLRAVVFTTPLAVCLVRSAARPEPVPPDRVCRIHFNLLAAYPVITGREFWDDLAIVDGA